MKRKLSAEFLGTFFLVLAGTGAIAVDSVSGGVIGHVGIALTFGLVVFAMIQMFGDISGAHFNPAVTIGFAASGRFAWKSVPIYIIAQFSGAIAASGLLKLILPSATTLGQTVPKGGIGLAFVFEFLMTAFLMATILRVSHGAREKGITAGLSIGAVVAFEALFGGPISGASMNPARSLGPAVMTWDLSTLWLYCCAPTLGALLAVPLCQWLHRMPKDRDPA
ncbi:MAG: aquaporin [Verrucomicrobiia bacterium Tous-C3TDCM]|nr:MAG: aquaporin [Verrucomicrobiae bacterium Tous-C3TDCM]PAZ04041.1 MAG: aquaporin [Verrucomicrobiae bacterium AMD-G2]